MSSSRPTVYQHTYASYACMPYGPSCTTHSVSTHICQLCMHALWAIMPDPQCINTHMPVMHACPMGRHARPTVYRHTTNAHETHYKWAVNIIMARRRTQHKQPTGARRWRDHKLGSGSGSGSGLGSGLGIEQFVEHRSGDRTRVDVFCDFEKVPPDQLCPNPKRD